MNNEKSQNTEKNKTGLIIGLGVALALGAVVLCIALISVFGQNSSNEDGATLYVLTSQNGVSESKTGSNGLGNILNNDSAVDSSVYGTDSNTVMNQNGAPNDPRPEETAPVKTTKNEAIEYYEHLSKNGENILSDHYSNEFIKLVSNQYGVDTDLLVAIYSEPDTGNNFVLQFDGSKDSSGNIIKSPDTLEKVYQIDLDRNIKIATGTQTGNVGVSYAEGMFCFNMVKTLVMEQYPNYFTGLKD